MLGSIIVVGVVGAVVAAVYFRMWRTARRNRGRKLTAKAYELLKNNKRIEAAECYAKASLAHIKMKSKQPAVEALEQYIAVARTAAIKIMLKGTKTAALDRIRKIQVELSKNLSDKIHALDLDKIKVIAQDKDKDVELDKARKAAAVLDTACSGSERVDGITSKADVKLAQKRLEQYTLIHAMTDYRLKALDELNRCLSGMKDQQSIWCSYLEQIHALDVLMVKARENDLGFVVDEALKIPEVEQAFLGAFSGLGEVL